MVVVTVSLSIYSWPVRSVSFSGDGQLLASGSEDMTIDIVSHLWSVNVLEFSISSYAVDSSYLVP